MLYLSKKHIKLIFKGSDGERGPIGLVGPAGDKVEG